MRKFAHPEYTHKTSNERTDAIGKEMAKTCEERIKKENERISKIIERNKDKPCTISLSNWY